MPLFQTIAVILVLGVVLLFVKPYVEPLLYNLALALLLIATLLYVLLPLIPRLPHVTLNQTTNTFVVNLTHNATSLSSGVFGNRAISRSQEYAEIGLNSSMSFSARLSSGDFCGFSACYPSVPAATG